MYKKDHTSVSRILDIAQEAKVCKNDIYIYHREKPLIHFLLDRGSYLEN